MGTNRARWWIFSSQERLRLYLCFVLYSFLIVWYRRLSYVFTSTMILAMMARIYTRCCTKKGRLEAVWVFRLSIDRWQHVSPEIRFTYIFSWEPVQNTDTYVSSVDGQEKFKSQIRLEFHKCWSAHRHLEWSDSPQKTSSSPKAENVLILIPFRRSNDPSSSILLSFDLLWWTRRRRRYFETTSVSQQDVRKDLLRCSFGAPTSTVGCLCSNDTAESCRKRIVFHDLSLPKQRRSCCDNKSSLPWNWPSS